MKEHSENCATLSANVYIYVDIAFEKIKYLGDIGRNYET
jgi:hypothetical protein